MLTVRPDDITEFDREHVLHCVAEKSIIGSWVFLRLFIFYLKHRREFAAINN
jgi:hypothetical protein